MGLSTVYTAMTAMMAQQARLDAAGQNVANVNTPGYARRRVLLAPLKGSLGNAGVEVGGGVDAVAVDRMLSPMLQAQIAFQSGRSGASSTLLEGFELAETAAARGAGDGFLGAMNSFFDAMGNVASAPSATSPRRLAITSAQTVCDQIGRTRSDLQQALQANDNALQADVTRANQLTTQIAELNVQIGAAPGASAGLQDQRDAALMELSGLTGAVGLPREDGTVDVLMGTHYLIQSGDSREFELVNDPSNPGMHTVSFRGETPPSAISGKIAGRLRARDEGVSPAVDALNDFAASFADAVNVVHAAGFAVDGATTGLDFFEYDPAAPADSLTVNPALVSDPTLLAAATSPSAPGDGSNALAMADLRTRPPAGQSTSLLDDYATWLAGMGADTNSARMRVDSDSSVLSSLESRQAAISGVSLDEEAVVLQEAQRAYVAAQRTVGVALEMMDAVLAMGL